jgi:hypothetical protein
MQRAPGAGAFGTSAEYDARDAVPSGVIFTSHAPRWSFIQGSAGVSFSVL